MNWRVFWTVIAVYVLGFGGLFALIMGSIALFGDYGVVLVLAVFIVVMAALIARIN